MSQFRQQLATGFEVLQRASALVQDIKRSAVWVKKHTTGLIYKAKWVPPDSGLIKLNSDATFKVLEGLNIIAQHALHSFCSDTYFMSIKVFYNNSTRK